MDLTELVKNCVTAVSKSAGFIDVLIMGDTIIVDAEDTSLGVINLGFDTQKISCFRYVPASLETDLSSPPDRRTMSKIVNYWKEYEALSSTKEEVARCDDLKAIPEYAELLAMKADEGLKFYKMPRNQLYQYCLVPVFSGFPNVAKADKVGIVVKQLSYDTLLMEYHIYKKKINRDITIWFKTLDLSKSYYQHKFKE